MQSQTAALNKTRDQKAQLFNCLWLMLNLLRSYKVYTFWKKIEKSKSSLQSQGKIVKSMGSPGKLEKN